MFSGNSSINIDSKGRIAIPAKYRDRLVELCEGKIVITRDPIESCLLVYTKTDWQEFARKLSKLSDMKPAERTVKRRYLGNAEECELDKNGRVVLPGQLRKDVNLDKAIRIVGQGNKLEIWAEDVWIAKEEADQAVILQAFEAGELPDLGF
jgi:MraZ protein